MSEQYQRYLDKLAMCMMTCQFIKEGLRFCLFRCHTIIKFRLHKYLPYETPFTAIDGAALGRLVDFYRVFTSNEVLIRDIRAIKADRDRIAHQGYLLTSENLNDDALLREKTQELDDVHMRAKECFDKLRTEMEKTDEIVNRVYAELRRIQSTKGDPLPATPQVLPVVGTSPHVP